MKAATPPFGLWHRKASVGAPILQTPLRTVATNNRIAVNRDRISTLGNQAVRHKYVVAVDASELVVNFNNWYISTSGESYAGALADLNFIDMSIEDGSGNVVPVFMGASRSFTIPVGGYDINSSPVLPSAFGKAKFSAGETYILKAKINVGVGGYIPYATPNTDSSTGLQVLWYNTPDTTLSSTDTPGAYTYTGTAPGTRTVGFRPILLGRPLVDGPSYICIGDSIAEGNGDLETSSGVHGTGFIARAMHNGSGGGSLRPLINTAKTGLSIRNGLVRRQALYKYARYAIDEIGANTLGATATGANLANIKNDYATAWAELRSGGIEKIIRTTLIPRCDTSSDQWATIAGQTINGGWGAGQEASQMNDWFQTKVSDGTLNHLVQLVSGRAPEDYWKHIVNGTVKYATVDGTHPSPAGSALWANDLRGLLTTLTS